MSAQPSLLAVFAHPDDEAFSSGATLAHYASLGVQVTLVCSTRGEAGKVTDPALGTITDLGVHREGELREACRILGIDPPIFLNYRDSGRLERLRNDDPLASINAKPREIERQVVEVIERVQPQVMLTFDPHGGYDHPDHLVIHRAALDAFFSSGHLPNPPQRLFYTAMPIELVRTMLENAPAITPGMTAEVYGVSAQTVAVRLEVAGRAEQKMAAIQAHKSQFGPNARFNQLPPAQREQMQRRFTGPEHFSLGGTRGPIARWPLNGFFDGLGFDGLE